MLSGVIGLILGSFICFIVMYRAIVFNRCCLEELIEWSTLSAA